MCQRAAPFVKTQNRKKRSGELLPSPLLTFFHCPRPALVLEKHVVTRNVQPGFQFQPREPNVVGIRPTGFARVLHVGVCSFSDVMILDSQQCEPKLTVCLRAANFRSVENVIRFHVASSSFRAAALSAHAPGAAAAVNAPW